MTSKWLGVWLAVLAAAQFVAGSANLADMIPDTAAAWFVLSVGALQVATAVYTGKHAAMPADFTPKKGSWS